MRLSCVLGSTLDCCLQYLDLKFYFIFYIKIAFFSILNLQSCIFSPTFVSSSPKRHSALAEFGSCRVSAAPCRWDEAVKGCLRPPALHLPPSTSLSLQISGSVLLLTAPPCFLGHSCQSGSSPLHSGFRCSSQSSSRQWIRSMLLYFGVSQARQDQRT